MTKSLLSDINIDTLTELFNIGIGQAASSLSDMINEHVVLTVPSVYCLEIQDAPEKAPLPEAPILSAVKQRFEGAFSGSALLIFPEKDSLELVRRILATDVSLEELSELEEDALLEVGNIILNACFYTISNLLDCKIAGDMPIHNRGNSEQLFSSVGIENCTIVLQLSMGFSIPNHAVNGTISFLMSMSELHKFIGLLDRYVEKLMS